MRYYKIVLDGQVAYTSLVGGLTDPGALNVELDVPVAPFATPMGFAMARVWGIGLEVIGQAKNLVGKNVEIYAGMAAGLPLANPRQAGLIVRGYVFQAFGNWIGTEQTLDIVVSPGSTPGGLGSPAAPKNIVLNWTKGQQLSVALKNCLSVGFPGYDQQINISSNLVRQSDDPGYFHSVTELGQYIKQASKDIIKDASYNGVDLVLVDKTFLAYDGTAAAGTTKQIAFQDLIGQPTWIEAPLIQWKTAMRADLKVGDVVKLPPSQITNTQQARSSLVNQNVIFQGSFTISLVRHVGNFRQPDAASWVTVFEGYPSSGSA